MHFSICDFLLDCLQNSVEAGAETIQLDIIQSSKQTAIRIRDNGRGMDEEELSRINDPFYSDGKKHPGRRVGLGVPFLSQALEATGKRLSIQSERGKGTEVAFAFDETHVDTRPLGDVASALVQAMIFPGSYELLVTREYKDNNQTLRYTLSRNELAEVLGGIETSGSLSLLRQYIRSREEEILEYFESRGVMTWQK